MTEAGRPGDARAGALVVRMGKAVQQHDRDRVETIGAGASKVGGEARLVERREHCAGGVDPFADLDDALVEHVGEANVEGEQVRTILVADA